MAVWGSIAFLATLLCTVTSAQNDNDIALMTDCLNDVSECPDDVLAQYPVCGNCSSVIKCAGTARSALFNCTSGLLYNKVLGVCQFSDMANTGCKSATISTTTTITTSNPNSVADCVTSCDGQPIGLYPDCVACEYFFICIDLPMSLGRTRCLDQLVWDNSVQRCLNESTTCHLPRTSE